MVIQLARGNAKIQTHLCLTPDLEGSISVICCFLFQINLCVTLSSLIIIHSSIIYSFDKYILSINYVLSAVQGLCPFGAYILAAGSGRRVQKTIKHIHKIPIQDCRVS